MLTFARTRWSYIALLALLHTKLITLVVVFTYKKEFSSSHVYLFADNRLASGDAEHAKRGPLLPLPTPPTPFPNSSSQSNAQNTFSTPTTEANDLTSKAAVNLNKIISALRSTSQG